VTDRDADELADLAARTEAAAALNRLAHALVAHRADDAVLTRIASAATRLATDIEGQPRRTRGTELSDSPRLLRAILEHQGLQVVVDDGAFIDMFHDSPISGSANPLSVGLAIQRAGDQAIGTVVLHAGWEGAPGRAHGGIVASCIDETIGGLLPLLGEMAFTGELSLRYLAPCPIESEVKFRARLTGRDGRKLYIACTGTHRDVAFVECTSTFITVDLERFAAGHAAAPR
jgi:hypothetical protein